MKIDINQILDNPKLTQPDIAYSYAINLLQDLKLTQGPQGVYSTLRRHKELNSFILSYQSDHLKSIEGLIADLDGEV